MKEKDRREKRAETKLGIKSMLQGINHLLDLGVLNNTEKNQLDTVEMYLKTLLSYYDRRTKNQKDQK